MSSNRESLKHALRRMAVPEPRHGFVDRVLSRAFTASRAKSREATDDNEDRVLKTQGRASTGVLGPFRRWETWLGAALGAAAAVVVTVAVLRPRADEAPAAAITLALNESRHIDVVIDSERTLEDATIRLATTGAVQLDGFENEREVEWKARLEQGRNVLSLPVVAHAEGPAQLVAVVEHDGRSRRIAIHLVVKSRAASEENV